MHMLTSRTEDRGLTEKGTAQRLKSLLEKFGLPTEAVLPGGEVLATVGMDKKKKAQEITLVVIEGIGRGRLHKIPCTALPEYIL